MDIADACDKNDTGEVVVISESPQEFLMNEEDWSDLRLSVKSTVDEQNGLDPFIINNHQLDSHDALVLQSFTISAEDNNPSFNTNMLSFDSTIPQASEEDLKREQNCHKVSPTTSFGSTNEMQLNFSPEDMGLPSLPLLSDADIKVYQETLVSENYQGNEYSVEQQMEAAQGTLFFVREYVTSPSIFDLASIFVGMNHNDNWADQPSTDENDSPIRTVTIRLRPDALCGAVMDACSASVQTFGGEITKRQGGHLRAILPNVRINTETRLKDENKRPLIDSNIIPAIRLDMQLVSKRKSREMDRVLLIRAFKLANPISPMQTQEIDIGEIGIMIDSNDNRLLEAASSVQKLFATKKVIQLDKTEIFSDAQICTGLFAHEPKLLSPLTKGRELKDKSTNRRFKMKNAHIPILYTDNRSFLFSSKCFVLKCLNELDSRGLSYSSLSYLPFCSFPALPTICPHYISQLRDMSQSSMHSSLLNSSKELEDFVADDDFWTAAIRELLTPKFIFYNVDPPTYPQPTSLDQFCQNFQSPEVTNPPWGRLVGEALNHFTKFLSTTTSAFEKSRTAVTMISAAFQRQADEEFAERLNRVNLHVMDRLGKSQTYRRNMIEIIQGLYSGNKVAAERADYFHRCATKAERSSLKYDVQACVPLFECNFSMGASSGLCMITAHEMLIITRLIPVVGEKTYHLLSLSDIDVSLSSVQTASLWDPITCLPSSSTITISRLSSDGVTTKLFSFKPAISPVRFKAFVDTLKDLDYPNRQGIQMSSSKGLLSLIAEHETFVKAALGN